MSLLWALLAAAAFGIHAESPAIALGVFFTIAAVLSAAEELMITHRYLTRHRRPPCCGDSFDGCSKRT